LIVRNSYSDASSWLFISICTATKVDVIQYCVLDVLAHHDKGRWNPPDNDRLKDCRELEQERIHGEVIPSLYTDMVSVKQDMASVKETPDKRMRRNKRQTFQKAQTSETK
jgi:hypothetical protein